jgi:HD-GYP domain-containing protein (c-di-GMP phosphodiesterase class II)
MLKKIPIKQIRKGMYVHEFCGSWIDHPFWKKSFLIGSEQDIQSIKTSKLTELIIDTDKGVDVQVDSPIAASPEASRAEDTSQTKKAHEVIRPISSTPVSMGDELNNASQIVAKSKKAVFDMFQEARMGNAVNVDSMEPLVKEISDSVSRNTGALIGLARLKTKDDYTYMHSIAVCALMIALGKQLNLNENEIKDAGMAGLLHDIGKMMIPVEILNKPSRLTDSEFDTVRQHPLAGYQILLRSKSISPVTLDVCLHHHEKIDGTGYPYRYSTDKISLMAKMGAVCDVYDAITSNRPYKKGWCPAESIKKMSEWSGKHFDETVFQAFVKSVGIYPAGSLVMMKSGRMGVVVEQNEAKLLLPVVRIFFSSKSMTYITPELIDLSRPGHNEKIVSREVVSKWGLQNIDRYWLGENYV